jgi:hypothetical protein
LTADIFRMTLAVDIFRLSLAVDIFRLTDNIYLKTDIDSRYL